MPEPCEFPAPNSRQQRFLWTHKEVDLAPHPVVGLVLRVGDAKKFPQALGVKGLDPFLRVSKQGPHVTDGGDKRLSELELACKADDVAKILFSLAIAEAILMQTSDQQVPPLQRITPRYLNLVTSNFWLFMLISALMLFSLFIMILLFSVLTSNPCAMSMVIFS